MRSSVDGERSPWVAEIFQAHLQLQLDLSYYTYTYTYIASNSTREVGYAGTAYRADGNSFIAIIRLSLIKMTDFMLHQFCRQIFYFDVYASSNAYI